MTAVNSSGRGKFGAQIQKELKKDILIKMASYSRKVVPKNKAHL